MLCRPWMIFKLGARVCTVIPYSGSVRYVPTYVTYLYVELVDAFQQESIACPVLRESILLLYNKALLDQEATQQ